MSTPSASEQRLHELLVDDLGEAVARTDGGGWTTTSNLPHEIRLHTEAGVELVRISAGMLVGVEPSADLLADINELNASRALSKRVLIDEKVLVVAEMPVASLRKGDLEHMVSMALCCARLDAPILAEHGGRPVTDPPPALAPDFAATVDSWWDVLRVSGTATARELAVWLDALVGCDCWIDHDDEAVYVVIDGTGTGSTYPCTLADLRSAAEDFEYEEEDDDEHAPAEPFNRAPALPRGGPYAR